MQAKSHFADSVLNSLLLLWQYKRLDAQSIIIIIIIIIIFIIIIITIIKG